MAGDYEELPEATVVQHAPGILVSGRFNEPCGYEIYRPGGTRDWLITLTHSGQGAFSTGGRTITCQSGDLMLLQPGTLHHYYTPEGAVWNFSWAHFNPPSRWLDWLRLPRDQGGCCHVPLGQSRAFLRMADAFGRLVSDNRSLDRLQQQLALNALEEILLLLAKQMDESTYADPRVEETLHYMRQHLQERITVEALAARVSLSPSRLAHLFKEHTGDSITASIVKFRLGHAARLLQHTTMNVAETAAEAGFNSPFYFTKQFTAMYGMSPTQYRSRSKPDGGGHNKGSVPSST